MRNIYPPQGTGAVPVTLSGETIDFDLNTVKNYAPYTHIVYTTGGTYKAHNTTTGATDYTGATLDPVLKSVLDGYNNTTGGIFGVTSGGSVYVQNGNHILSGSFAGWDMPQYTKVVCGPNCFINVASGYTGYVFRIAGRVGAMPGGTQYMTILDGFTVREAGANSFLWDAILLDANTSAGIFNILAQNLSVIGGKNAIHLKINNAAGFGNGNVFRNITTNNTASSVLFDLNSISYSTSVGFHRNLFQSIEGEAAANTANGFKDIHGVENMFIDCKIWDISGGQISSNITANADHTMILGGIMTSLNFVDSGTNTFIWDDITGFKTSSTVNLGRISLPSAPSAGTSRMYSRQLTTNEDGLFTQQNNLGYIREVQLDGVPRTNYRQYGAFNSIQAGFIGMGILTGITTTTNGTGASTSTTLGSPSYKVFNSGSVANNSSSARLTTVLVSRATNATLNFKFRNGSTSASIGSRIYLGFSSQTSATAGGADPLPNLSGIGFWYDPSVSANFRYAYNSGTASSTIADFTSPVVGDNTTDHVVSIRSDATNNQFIVYFDGVAQVQSSGNIPAGGTGLGIQIWYDSIATTQNGMRLYYAELFCD